MQSDTSTLQQSTGYFGGKGGAGVYQAIISAMPWHEIYYELMLGSGQIMRRKQPVLKNIGYDLDGEAVLKFNATTPDYMTAKKGSMVGCDDIQGDNVLIYCDPPYPWRTRTSSKRYKYDWTDKQHIDFLNWVKVLTFRGCKVMISTYPNDIYSEALSDWRYIDFTGQTRGGPRTERLYMNYDQGKPFCATYAGRNRTDRQRIKRKAARWAKAYDEMPPQERMAILSEIMAIESRQD